MAVILSILLFLHCTFAQQKDALKILNDIKHKYDLIKDYEVDAEIKFDFSSIKVPDTKIKIYYKKPNKTKIQSDNFAMIPKQAVSFSPIDLFKSDYSAVFVRSELLDSKSVDVIKVIPNSDTTDIILSTLWIDSSEKLIRKIETVNKHSMTVRIDLSYNDNKYGLPSKVIFSFGSEEKNGNQTTQKNLGANFRRSLNGTVTIIYSNYKINKGIPDKIFMNN